jgi:hypothetical protein
MLLFYTYRLLIVISDVSAVGHSQVYEEPSGCCSYEYVDLEEKGNVLLCGRYCMTEVTV